MEKILVMGGSYFIGKKIVEVLLENNYEVYVLNRGSNITPQGAKQLICDRNDENQMRNILKELEFEIVVDVSGLNSDHASILYKALNKNKIKKFIFISSSAVYDIDKLNLPFKETDILGENKYWGQYGTDKIAAEVKYQELFKQDSMELIILRPPYVYGENNYAQRESFIFDHIYYNKPIIIPASNPRLQFIYTTDLANIIIKLINTKLPNLAIFNVGNKKEVLVSEWIDMCAKVMGKSHDTIMFDYKEEGYMIRDFFPFHDYSNVLDVTKINEIYEIETNFEVGLRAAYEWYLENQHSIVFKKNVLENETKILSSINKE